MIRSKACRILFPARTVVLILDLPGLSLREVSLLGAMPVDVLETRAAIDQTTHRQKGLAGSAVTHDPTTLIDVTSLAGDEDIARGQALLA